VSPAPLLEQSFRALHALEDQLVAKAIAGITKADAGDKNPSRWRQAIEKRYTSILAHGIQPIGADGFAAMKQIAAEFLGFELEVQSNPFPPLDVRWL
jgi:hypothetical protein